MRDEMAEDKVALLKEEFGRELRRLRIAANLTQKALASKVNYHRVSITQIESGRQDFSRQFATLVEAVLDAKGSLLAIYQQLEAERNRRDQPQLAKEPPTNRRRVFYALGALASSPCSAHPPKLVDSDDAYTVESLHDEALKCIGCYDFDRATKYLEAALVLLAKPHRPEREWNFLRARCLVTLCNIQRDRGRLGGRRGALANYMDCLDFYLSEDETTRAVELCLYVGACYEMSGQFSFASRYYRMGEGLAQQSSLKLLPAYRCILRQGTVLTKQGRHEAAYKRIMDARRGFIDLCAEQLVEFSAEKLALADYGAGKLASALSHATGVRALLPAERSLRSVQSSLVLATIMNGYGETSDALKHATEAMTVSSDLGLGHQFAVAWKLSKRLSGDEFTPATVKNICFVPVAGYSAPPKQGSSVE